MAQEMTDKAGHRFMARIAYGAEAPGQNLQVSIPHDGSMILLRDERSRLGFQLTPTVARALLVELRAALLKLEH